MDPTSIQQAVDIAMAAARADLEAQFGSAIDNLKGEITSLHTLLHNLWQDKASSAQPQRPKPRLPDPEKFTGQPHRWDTWLLMIEAKIRIDKQAIGDDEAVYFYVYNNLESKAQSLVTPQVVAANTTKQFDYQALLSSLARVFDDPNKVDDALKRLRAQKQGTDTFASYLTKFERVLHEAKADNWPDSAKISALSNGLSSHLKQRLDVQLTLPEDYAGFVKACQRLSGGFGGGFPSFSSHTGPGSSHHNNTGPNLSHTTNPDSMELNTIQADVPKDSILRRLLAKEDDN